MPKIEISHRTIIFTVIFLLSLKVLWLIKDLLFALFIAFIIMSALKPFVDKLTKIKIPRALAGFLVYALFLAGIFNLIFFAIPPLVKESASLISQFPGVIEGWSPTLDSLFNLNSVFQNLPNITNQVFGFIGGLFSNVVFFVSIIFFSYYFVIEENLTKDILIKFIDEKQAKSIELLIERIQNRLSSWFWGEATLMTVVGLGTYIGLRLIGMEYALPLAVLAGLLEIVPNLGPVLSAIPAIIIGLGQSYFLAFSNLALYFIVQQVENNFIVPLVMKKVVGLSPIVTLVALIIGGKLDGFSGVVLAVPTTLVFETILISLLKKQKVAYLKK